MKLNEHLEVDTNINLYIKHYPQYTKWQHFYKADTSQDSNIWEKVDTARL